MLTLKKLFFLLLYAGWTAGLLACTSLHQESDQGFTYSSIPVASGSAGTGDGASITFRGTPLPLTGHKVQVGEPLRSVMVARKDLSLLDLTAPKGRVRILSIVPSLDTKVCEQQTHYLSEKNNGLDASVDLYTISLDTPFAQDRFAREARIHNVTFLSDYREAAFGRAHGLLLEGPHLLGRAVMVVDQQNIIRYLQVPPDLGNMPDMDAAFAAARALSKG